MKNKYLILVLSLFLVNFLSSQMLATPPSLPPCYDVENPEHYKNLVFDSKIYSYFQDWQLKNITVPCHYKIGAINVVHEYKVPQSYSPNNLNYQTTIVFSFQDDQLINADELNQVFGDYKKHIQNFENLEATKFFIETTGATNVKHKQKNLFELESKPREYLNYNFIDGQIDSLSFANSLLINELSLFIPKSSSISQIDEFKKHVGINFVELQNNRLSIHEDFSCPTCESYFTYDLDQLFSTTYSLDNNFEWKTFPGVQRAHTIIKENLLINELSNCTIATGDMHTYTIVRFHNSPSDSWFMTVALKCDGGTRWKDALIRLNPDGTYDRLEIQIDYHPKTKPKSTNIILYISILLVLIIGIILLFIKFRRK